MLSLLCGLAACASLNDEERGAEDEDAVRRGDCIHEPSIRGYRVLDEQNLIVDASVRRSYHVVLYRRAYGLRSSWGIAFESPTGRICEGFGEIRFDGDIGYGADTTRIKSIRELTPDEVDDLLIRFGKKEPEIEQTPAPQEVKGAEVEELDKAANE